MKESTWLECLENYASLKITPDKAKAKSLIDTAKGRNLFLDEHDRTEDNANYLFEGYYSSVLELLHALVLSKGYKVENHICLGYYLRDVLRREDLFRLFDDCRIKRNFLVYYGRKMDFATAKAAVERIKRLIGEVVALMK